MYIYRYRDILEYIAKDAFIDPKPKNDCSKNIDLCSIKVNTTDMYQRLYIFMWIQSRLCYFNKCDHASCYFKCLFTKILKRTKSDSQ